MKDKKFFLGHERLAQERARFWGTQQEAADYFGVSRVTWGQYERGNATPSADVLAGLAQKGADVMFVLTGQPSQSARPALSPRAAALLDNFEHTSEEGKKVIESTANLAAKSAAAGGRGGKAA